MSDPQSLSTNSTRFAIYTRYSSEMQNEISLDAQEALCREAIAERDGVTVAVYSDGAKSGWSLEREGFQALRKAAAQGEFDAVMFWKFDRLARDQEHAVMIKMLLRHEYKLKLYCVEGYSEDEDDSLYSTMMEQLLAVFSAFYSRNLSTDTKRGKRHRVMQGEFNGSVAPLGYVLVTRKKETEDCPAGLYVDPRAAALVRRAFILYSTGEYSDADIANWLNQQPHIQKLRQNKRPIGKEMVRDLLQNRVYTGRVPYAETLYNRGMGQGKQSSRGRKEWFEGKHQGFVSDVLFDQCQEVRKTLATVRKVSSKVHTYVLHNRCYCARCIAERPDLIGDKRYGKMRPSTKAALSHYHCMARDRGYRKCEQSQVEARLIDRQVVNILTQLNIPANYRNQIESAVNGRMEHDAIVQRMQEIESIVQRIDFSWEQGFLLPHEYMEKRQQLQEKLTSLQSDKYNKLIEAADLLKNFKSYWDSSLGKLDTDKRRQQLMQKVIERVYIYDKQVVAVALYGGFLKIVDGVEDFVPKSILDAIQL